MIFQLLPSLSVHDAISQHVLQIDSYLKNKGIHTQIVAEHINPLVADKAIHASQIDSFDNAHILYHMSISSSLADRMMRSNSKLDMWYHNITPSQFFEPWEPFTALELRIARQQLKHLALRADRALAASQYSVNELKKVGLRNVEVMPVLFDVQAKSLKGERLNLDGTNILCVGRFAPHKKNEKVIMVFNEYKRLCDNSPKLHFVGTSASGQYFDSLNELIRELGIGEDVIFHENVDDTDLANLYQSCDVYLTMSEHEGFCVPILEAIYAELPVVATNAAAIPETLGSAGYSIDVNESIYKFVSAIDLIVKNTEIRQKLKKNAAMRRSEFDLESQTKLTCDWLLDKV